MATKNLKLPEIPLVDYHYPLPEDRIAQFPLSDREASKLLYYNKGSIHHHKFYELPDLLPQDSFLFFNNTKVIPARLYFKKRTGAEIEILLISPIKPTGDYQEVMSSESPVVWETMIGNLKKWKESQVLETEYKNLLVEARLIDPDKQHVEFSWNNKNLSFAEIITKIGNIPLPPYMKRSAEKLDKERYQTVYSRKSGAVAAPTAGLHFTNDLIKNIQKKKIGYDQLTLHVSAGTFQPIKVKNAVDHPMHEEQIIVSKNNIRNLKDHLDDKIIAVGTTSMRVLESLYWYGLKILERKETTFKIDKLFPYKQDKLPDLKECLDAVLNTNSKDDNLHITGKTEIFIFPGYKFQVCKGLITNFHLPGSSLLLLVAAFAGNDWKRIYNEALNHNYRFLSYGDSSLLFPDLSF